MNEPFIKVRLNPDLTPVTISANLLIIQRCSKSLENVAEIAKSWGNSDAYISIMESLGSIEVAANNIKCRAKECDLD